MPVAGFCSVPFGGLLKSSRDFGIGFFVPAPLARTICLPWAQKIRQLADSGRPHASAAQLLHFSVAIRPEIPTILRVSLNIEERVTEKSPTEGVSPEGVWHRDNQRNNLLSTQIL